MRKVLKKRWKKQNYLIHIDRRSKGPKNLKLENGCVIIRYGICKYLRFVKKKFRRFEISPIGFVKFSVRKNECKFITLALVSFLRKLQCLVKALHQQRIILGLIHAGGPIVDGFCWNFRSWNLNANFYTKFGPSNTSYIKWSAIKSYWFSVTEKHGCIMQPRTFWIFHASSNRI